MEPELNKDNVEKWVAALESERWPQAVGSLVHADATGKVKALCAVGVGMATMLEDQGCEVRHASLFGIGVQSGFAEWLGSPRANLDIDRDEELVTVIGLNDYYEEAFPLIAQRIRKKYL